MSVFLAMPRLTDEGTSAVGVRTKLPRQLVPRKIKPSARWQLLRSSP